jgi:mannosyltransferase OCH1-like enzyme
MSALNDTLRIIYHRYNVLKDSSVLLVDPLNDVDIESFFKSRHNSVNNYKASSVQEDMTSKDGLFIDEKYEIVVSTDISMFEKLKNNVLLKGMFIFVLDKHYSLNTIKIENGFDILYVNDKVGIYCYKKYKNYEQVKSGNEYKNYIGIRNSYEVMFDKSLTDIVVHIYMITKNKIKIELIRFDQKEPYVEGVKIVLYNIDGTKQIIIDVKEEIEEIDVCEFEIVKINNTKQKIPKLICQTLDDNVVGEIHFRTIKNLKMMNSEYEYVFFDSVERRRFIKTHFNKTVVDMYDGFVSGAFKADIFRYCWLYVIGGVYIDCKMIARVPLRQIIDQYDETYLCRDRIPNAYQNNFICSVSSTNEMLNCIKESTARFEGRMNKRVSFGSLYHTGPYLFYSCMKTKIAKCEFSAPFEISDYRTSTIRLIKNNLVIFNVYFKDYYKNYTAIHKKPMWSTQWANNEIYYSKKYVIKNMNDYHICIYPNQLADTELISCNFKLIKNELINNKSDNLKCKLICDTSDKEKIILVHRDKR